VTNATSAAMTITLGTAAAAAGVVTLNGNDDVDNITLGSGFTNSLTITAGGGADIYDFTSYTKTVTVATGTGAHGITLGAGTEKITGGSGVETVQVAATAHLASSDVITGATGADVINFSAAATVTDAQFTNVTGFTTITSGDVILNLTLGAESTEAGITIITLGNAANVLNASAHLTTALTITGGTGADTIQGGTGADIIVGGNGADIYKFASTAALNGLDVLVANFVVADDRFDFSNFLPGGSVHANSAVVQHDGADDINITNKLVHAATTNSGVADLNTAAKIVAELQGATNAFHLDSGGKAIILAGDDSAATAGAQIWFIDDTLDGVNGTVSATDVIQVGILTLDIDTTTDANFIF
jgi:Ca2+-binding RTX toxin-like protein